MHRIETNPALVADIPLENKLPANLQTLIATVCAVAAAALGFWVAGIVGLALGALAGLGIVFAAVQPITDIDQASQEQLHGLIDFFNVLPFPNKPHVQGSIKEQAQEVRTWMLKSEEIQNCQRLDLKGRRLKTIPKEIGLFHQLKALLLQDNLLEAIPAEIGNLQALRELNLATNQLQALPPEIGNLHALDQLNLRMNKLEQLPPEIQNLQALRILNLMENEFLAIPLQINNLAALAILFISGNKFQNFPPRIGNLQDKGDGMYQIQ